MTLEVEVRSGNMDEALRVLKRAIGRDGILIEVKERDLGHKASDRKKAKRRKAQRSRIKRDGRRRPWR